MRNKEFWQNLEKKLCNSSEMHFLPRPGGSGEDDGVLVTIVFDGHKEQVVFTTMIFIITMIFIVIIVLSLWSSMSPNCSPMVRWWSLWDQDDQYNSNITISIIHPSELFAVVGRNIFHSYRQSLPRAPYPLVIRFDCPHCRYHQYHRSNYHPYDHFIGQHMECIFQKQSFPRVTFLLSQRFFNWLSLV